MSLFSEGDMLWYVKFNIILIGLIQFKTPEVFYDV